MIKHLENESEFASMTSGKCVVDFYADWCGPCKMMAVVLEEVCKDVDVPIIKVNTDEFPKLATKFGVMSIPTIILMEDGKEVNKHIGYMSKQEFLEFIK